MFKALLAVQQQPGPCLPCLGGDRALTAKWREGHMKELLAEMKGKVPVSTTISADKSLMAVLYFSIDDHAIRLFDLTTGKFIRNIPRYFDFLLFPKGR